MKDCIVKIVEIKGKNYKVLFGRDVMHLKGMLSFNLDDVENGIIVNDEGMSGISNANALRLLREMGEELRRDPAGKKYSVNYS